MIGLLIFGIVILSIGIAVVVWASNEGEFEVSLLGVLLMVIGIGIIAVYVDGKSKDVSYVFLPEEYKQIKRGDTLRITEKGDVMQAEFYNGVGDRDNLYIVK